jgi:hypothetical protein
MSTYQPGAPRGFGLRTTARTSAKGYAIITGVKETRQFMLRIAKDYKTYNSWMKRGAELVAAEARRGAPLETSKLARSLVGRASARVTQKDGTRRGLIGGVVVANVPYGKSVSFGRYYPAGPYIVKRSRTAPPFEGFRTEAIRSTNNNKYLKLARERAKPNVVALWNQLLKRYIQVNDFEYNITS